MNKVIVTKTKGHYDGDITLLVQVGGKTLMYNNVAYECDSASSVASVLVNLADAGVISLEYTSDETKEWMSKHQDGWEV